MQLYDIFLFSSCTPCLCVGSGSRTVHSKHWLVCTYCDFIGCKIGIIFVHDTFFKKNNSPFIQSAVNGPSCTLKVFSWNVCDACSQFSQETFSLIQGKLILYPCCRRSRDHGISTLRLQETMNMVQQSKAIDVRLTQIIINWISETASPALSYWASDPLPVDLKGHIQFSESEVLAFPAGMCLLPPMMLVGLFYLAACCACMYTSLPLCMCEFAAEPGWSWVELLLKPTTDQMLLCCVVWMEITIRKFACKSVTLESLLLT